MFKPSILGVKSLQFHPCLPRHVQGTLLVLVNKLRTIPFCWGASLMWFSHPLVDRDPTLQYKIDVPEYSFPVLFDSLSCFLYLSCMFSYSLMGQPTGLKSCIVLIRESCCSGKFPHGKLKSHLLKQISNTPAQPQFHQRGLQPHKDTYVRKKDIKSNLEIDKRTF